MGTFLAELSLRAAAKLMVLSEVLIPQSVAATFVGTGMEGGIDAAEQISGISGETDFRQLIINIIVAALNFIGIIAVGAVIIAGIRLIISMGGDEQKDKAKKSLIHVVIGLTVIILSRVMVSFVVNFFPVN